MAGYHLFSTGEVLTAANVNDYVMKQTVMVFASAAARTTALSGVLREGMTSYRTDSHVFEVYNGTAWVASETNLTTKGDLATYDTAPNRLAVGADGTTLVANSSAATGLSYQPLNSAGKNAVINGGMDIWQRGTSFTASGYTADRWYVSVAGTCTVSQITSSLPSNFQYGIQWVAGASNSYAQFIQAIEKANVIPLQGKTMTISGWVKASANYVGNWLFQNYYSTSTDTQAGDTVQNGSNVFIATNATTTWTRFSVTFTVPSTAVGLSMNFVPDNAAQVSTGTIQMTGIQLELGSTATTFSRAGGTLQGELAACKRYFEKSFELSTAPANGTTALNTTTGAFAGVSMNNSYSTYVPFQVEKRTSSPTITLYGNSSGYWGYTASSAAFTYAATAFTVSATGSNSFSGSQTQANNTFLVVTGHWTASAEL